MALGSALPTGWGRGLPQLATVSALADQPSDPRAQKEPENRQDHSANSDPRALISIDRRHGLVDDAEMLLSKLGQEVVRKAVARIEVIQV